MVQLLHLELILKVSIEMYLRSPASGCVIQKHRIHEGLEITNDLFVMVGAGLRIATLVSGTIWSCSAWN